MIVEILRKLAFDLHEEGDNTYKIILDRPSRCTKCGADVVSVGFTKLREIVDWVNDDFQTIRIRHSRYRCKSKDCRQYCYCDDKKRLDRFLSSDVKIFKDAKLAIIRARLKTPTKPYEKLAEELSFGASTIQKFYKAMSEKYLNINPKPIIGTYQIVFEVKHRGKEWLCVFGLLDNDVFLTTMLEADNVGGFLAFYNKLYKPFAPEFKLDLIWHINHKRMAKLLDQYTDTVFVVDTEDYTQYQQLLSNKVGEGVSMRLRPNNLPYNKVLIKEMTEDVLLMLDHHISLEEIVFLFCFRSNITRELLSEVKNFNIYL